MEIKHQFTILLNHQLLLPPKTKDPTQEMNPDKNELNGKVPTRQQYANWMIPVNMM